MGIRPHIFVEGGLGWHRQILYQLLSGFEPVTQRHRDFISTPVNEEDNAFFEKLLSVSVICVSMVIAVIM